MARYRPISTHIWRDPDFVKLDAEAKLLFLFILTNDGTTTSGIYVLPPSQMISFITGVSIEKIEETLAEKFKNISYDKESHAIFIKNFLRYNNSGNPTYINKSIEGDYAATKSSKLWREFVKEYPDYREIVKSKPEPEPDEIVEEGKKLSPRDQNLLALFVKHTTLAKGNGFFPTYDLENEAFLLTMLGKHRSRLNKCWKNTVDHFPGEEPLEVISNYLEWFHRSESWWVEKGLHGISHAFPIGDNVKFIDYIHRSRGENRATGAGIDLDWDKEK